MKLDEAPKAYELFDKKEDSTKVIFKPWKIKKRSPPMMHISTKELPADEPLEALQPVAYFNGMMPTGVTPLSRRSTIKQFNDMAIVQWEKINRSGHFQTMYLP